MDLDDLIVATYCLVDAMLTALLAGARVRQRGPDPILGEAEVLSMETVGAHLGLTQDKALFDYFRRHYGHFYPVLRCIHRTTFARQAGFVS